MMSGLSEIFKAQNGEGVKEDEFAKKVDMTKKVFEAYKKVNDKPRKLTLQELASMTKSTKGI